MARDASLNLRYHHVNNMAARKKPTLQIDNLTGKAQHRYLEKIFEIEGLDPYEIPKHSWSSNPDVTSEKR